MNPKLIRTIFTALALGFFVVWVLEFRRAGMLESYWLLLVSIVCFLLFQFNRLKAATAAKKNEETPIIAPKKGKPVKTTKK